MHLIRIQPGLAHLAGIPLEERIHLLLLVLDKPLEDIPLGGDIQNHLDVLGVDDVEDGADAGGGVEDGGGDGAALHGGPGGCVGGQDVPGLIPFELRVFEQAAEVVREGDPAGRHVQVEDLFEPFEGRVRDVFHALGELGEVAGDVRW